MSDYYFFAASASFLLLFNFALVSAPGILESATGLNTTSLQDQTDIGTSVNANQTTESNAVDQAGQLAAVYTNQNSTNQLLSIIFTIYLILFAAWLVDKVWLG